MTAITADSDISSADTLKSAVHQHRVASFNGLLERLFTISSDHRVITIASGGCNALSYMTASPASLIAVDLNPAHIALTQLKLAAARHLPVYEQFRRFFARSES